MMLTLCPLMFIASGLFCLTNVRGQDIWTNPDGGLFHDGANWTDGTAPTAEELASFDLPDTYSVQWDASTGDTLGSGLSVNGGSLTLFSIGETRSHALFNASTSAVTAVRSGNLTLGRSATEGFNLHGGDFVFIRDAGDLQVHFGSELIVNDTILVGSTNHGSFGVSSGGRVISANGQLAGNNSNGNGFISGTGSSWVLNDFLKVGSFRGNSNMEVRDGGSLTAASIDVGGFESTTIRGQAVKSMLTESAW